ncbi:histidinol dehydrogenase [Staphylococcus aureus]|nr:histidinol dehydrogenase [Staphylococcus aureus]MRW78380.1 histidinol dehydrogenase [Staphylococcus aureus]NEF66350.1 histidinol dehydrogenase [Staphylococcus aureus]NGC29654.1 histidinol dehydrogenase [Staphylococcus aureus]
MLRIAIAKGRLMDSLINYLDAIEFTTLSETLKNRERQLLLSVDNIECILVKGSDVPIYVEQGIADIGIVGSDILDERHYNVNNLLDMPFGACHFAVAAKPETTKYHKIATSYVHTAEAYFKSKGIDVELIKLSGSVELACVVDMVDGIVDIVQTGTTLEANGLVEKQHISDINARLITNKAAYFKKSQLIEQFIRSLEVSIVLNAQQFLNQFSLEAPLDESLYPIIRDICQEVKVHGDKALKMYNLTFDHTKTDHLEISHEQIKAAFDTLDEKTKQALQQSYERIKAYQESIKQTNQQLEKSVECYEIYHPLESVGIYVPGGKASYPSTVLMTATLAQVAGVENIVVVTPPQPNGVSQEVLAACYITQVNQVFQVGGAQSIAALTYGTETIPKVDKIVGPGNQFVAYAKKYLFGQVGIDQIAGPTEIALIIDDTADLDAIVYDVFAQAEHDELARTYVISEDAQVLKDLESRIAKALPNVDRYDIVSKSIANQHYLIHASNFDEACYVMNTIAPEHASIQTVNPQPYIEKVKYVGALFIGHYSPEVIGDYVAGPSHVLPTNRTARFTNGLSVNDFLTRNTVIHLSKDTFDQIADSAQHIAHVEALYNHQQSILIRQS